MVSDSLSILGRIRHGSDGRLFARRGAEEPAHGSPTRRLRQGLGYLSEDRKGEGLTLPLSVADNVTLTRLHKCSRRRILDTGRHRHQAEQ